MFALFFRWIRDSVKQAVFAGLKDAADELEDASAADREAVEAFRAKVLTTGKKKGAAS